MDTESTEKAETTISAPGGQHAVSIVEPLVPPERKFNPITFTHAQDSARGKSNMDLWQRDHETPPDKSV